MSPAARDAKSNVLFFPGDVHDFRANMLSGAFSEFAAFAYESVADVLASKFGSGDDCNVWIVHPARFHQRAFSCFDNFVDANEYGAATSCTSDGLVFLKLILLVAAIRLLTVCSYAQLITDSSAGSAIKHLLALIESVRDTLQQQGGACGLFTLEDL